MLPGGTPRRAIRLAAASLAALLALARVGADEYQDRRAETGVRLFRALLTADLDLDRKLAADGHLTVVFLYVGNKRRAADLAQSFARVDAAGSPEPVRGLGVTIVTSSDPGLA